MAKRRPRGEGGIHRRSSDGLWVGTLDLGWRDGRRRRKVVYAKTKTAALRKLNEAKADLARYGDLPTAGQTVEQWLTYWLAEIARRQVKPTTLASYRSHVHEYLIPAIGHIRLDRLTPADVRSVHRYIENKGLSSTTARHAHRTLSGALRAAVRDGRLARNVASKEYVDAPRKAVHGRAGLTAAQARAVLHAASQDRLASRWMAGFLTGARQGELLGLRWQFVDMQNGVLDFAWALTRLPYSHGCGPSYGEEESHACGKPQAHLCPWRRLDVPAGMEYEVLGGNLTLMRPKTAASRRLVPIAAPLHAALQLRWNDYLTERGNYVADHGLVWPREDGRPIDGRADYRRWRALLDEAGVPPRTLHETRNTAATLLRDAGVDDTVAAELLGHTDVAITRGYQRRTLDRAREAVTALGRMLDESV